VNARGSWLATALGSVACALANPALAQINLPGPAQIPQAQQRFEPEPPPLRTAPGALPRPTAVTAPPLGADQILFTLRRVTFNGSTLYSAEDLGPIYAPLVGHEVSLADLYAVAAQVTDRYRRDGYLLSIALVPEQQVEDGAVSIQIVEGFIGAARLDGRIDGPRDLPQGLADRITASRPLQSEDLERRVLLIGDLPGVNVQSVLHPSRTTFGAADLDVVVRQTPWAGFLSLDNLGSRYLGPYALSAGLSEYSRLGRYEQIDLTGAIDPDHQDMGYIHGAVTVPLHGSGPLVGDTLQLAGLYSRAEPDIPEDVFPFKTRSVSAEGRLTYFVPLIRSRDQNLSARQSFIWRDLSNRITDLPEDARNPGEEHVRIWQSRLTYDVVDRSNAVSIIDVVGNVGLGIFGASRNADPRLIRQDGDGQFFYVSGTAARLQPLTTHVALYARTDFQYSGQPLPTTERFGLGGPNAGVGYAPGNITGDSGLDVRIEARYGRETGLNSITGFQLYGRYDYGFTSDHTSGPDDWNSLSTVGLGVRLNLFKALAFNPEISRQLSGRPADCSRCSRETRLLFSLTQRF
jgi:hemolysin activation/secretion protein